MTPDGPDASSPAPSTSSWWEWWLRDRTTGEIVIAQFPNPALWVWGACLAIQALAAPSGDTLLVVRGAGRAALLVWALDEIVRGSNPFRRALGVVVLLVSVPGWFRS